MTDQELAKEISVGLQQTVGEIQGKENLPALYVDWLKEVKSLNNPRCIIYAGLWCTYSQLLVTNFLIKADERGKDLNSLREMYNIFKDDFCYAIIMDEHFKEFEKRARIFLNYVGDLDLSGYGVPEYDKAEEWI